jgi:hypothetical protein
MKGTTRYAGNAIIFIGKSNWKPVCSEVVTIHSCILKSTASFLFIFKTTVAKIMKSEILGTERTYTLYMPEMQPYIGKISWKPVRHQEISIQSPNSQFNSFLSVHFF